MTNREIAQQKARNSIELSNIVRKKRIELALLEDKFREADEDFERFIIENKQELPDLYECLGLENRGEA